MEVVRILREWEAHGKSLDQGWFLGWEGHRNVRSQRHLGSGRSLGVGRGHWVIGLGHTSSHSVPLTMKASHSRHLAGPLSRRSRWV